MSIEETPPAETTPVVGGSYEFSESENKVFDGLAKKARGVGFWFIIYGGILLLGFVRKLIAIAGLARGNRAGGGTFEIDIDLGTLIAGLILVAVGIWSRRAASGFEAVVKTQGGDIGHLMAAIKDLSKLYGLLERIIFIAVVLIILIMIAALIGVVMTLTAARP